jgi:O-methyltransferase domain/Dimerisation domain
MLRGVAAASPVVVCYGPSQVRLLHSARITGEDLSMSRSDSGQPGRGVQAAGSAGGTEPAKEERAAAAAVFQMISGIHISRAVYVVAELGIADLLAGGPMTAAQLARATQAHEPSLYRVLRLLASLGVLTELDDRSFGLTVLGERLRSDVPASMRSFARLTDVSGLQPFEPIIEVVKTGRSGHDIVYGMGPFEFLAAHPERSQKLQAALSERTAAFARSVAAGYDFSPMRTVADIGGGNGTLLAAILQAHGHLRGILFDVPPVVAGAAEVLRAAGVADRCDIVPGDFFQGVPDGADAYLLANVVHDWDDASSVRILGACRQSAADDGRVLLIERLIPDRPADAVPALLSDLNMLVITGGRERTTAEYDQLLAQAGLNRTQVRPVAPPYSVIEGVPS